MKSPRLLVAFVGVALTCALSAYGVSNAESKDAQVDKHSRKNPQRFSIDAGKATDFPGLSVARATVRDAAKSSSIGIDSATEQVIFDAYGPWYTKTRRPLLEVAPESRLRRMQRYLEEKRGQGDAMDSLFSVDFADFSWDYVSKHYELATVKLELDAPAILDFAACGGDTVSFSTGTVVSRSFDLVMPTWNGKQATLAIRNPDSGGKCYWSGTANSGVVRLEGFRMDSGCEITINSVPDQAEVTINGKKWEPKTNTSYIGDAGSYMIAIHRSGYRDWKEQKRLGSGETWFINAALVAAGK